MSLNLGKSQPWTSTIAWGSHGLKQIFQAEKKYLVKWARNVSFRLRKKCRRGCFFSYTGKSAALA